MTSIRIAFTYEGVSYKYRVVLNNDYELTEHGCNWRVEYTFCHDRSRVWYDVMLYADEYDFNAIITIDGKCDIYVYEDGADMYCDEIHGQDINITIKDY